MQVKAPKVTQVPVQRIDYLGHPAEPRDLDIRKKNMDQQLLRSLRFVSGLAFRRAVTIVSYAWRLQARWLKPN